MTSHKMLQMIIMVKTDVKLFTEPVKYRIMDVQ